MAREQKYDILKQPTLTLLVTFAALIVVQTLRAVRFPLPSEELSEALSPVGSLLDGAMCSTTGTIVVVLSVIFSSVLITRIIGRYSLSVVRSFVPMALLTICAYGVLYPIGSPSMALAVVMIIHAEDLMLLSFKRTECFGEVMRAAFWIALAALLIPDLIYVVALLPVQWFIWQRSPREMVAALITLSLPLLITSCLYWFDGEVFVWFWKEWTETLSPLSLIVPAELVTTLGGVIGTALLGVITLATIAGIILFATNHNGMRLRARKGHICFVMLFFMGLTMLLCGIPAGISTAVMGVASVPLLHTLFVRRKGIVGVLLYLSMVILTALAALLPLYA